MDSGLFCQSVDRLDSNMDSGLVCQSVDEMARIRLATLTFPRTKLIKFGLTTINIQFDCFMSVMLD